MNSLIVITDSLPAANGGGISQTLYNLLDAWPSTIFYVTRPAEARPTGPLLHVKLVAYRFERYRYLRNRVFKIWNRRVVQANFTRQQALRKLPEELPQPTAAVVLVSTTEPIKLHFAWLLQSRFGYTVIPYFMDDWMAGLELKWKQGLATLRHNNIQAVVASLLRTAPCRLLISKQLDAELIRRYGLEKKPTLVIHNPAPETVGKRPDERWQMKDGRREMADDRWQVADNKTIIYAGSIWPMHFDALLAVSKAVQLLNLRDAAQREKDSGGLRQAQPDKNGQAQPDKIRQAQPDKNGQAQPDKLRQSFDKLRITKTQGDNPGNQAQPDNEPFRLIIYTSEAVWQHNRKALEGPGVEYGGFIPYNSMPEKLVQGWLLLVTASFLPQYLPFTNSSVQTKLTDYMAAGKPVLFVGPAEGASGQFVHEWDCGFTIGSPNPEDVAAQLEAIRALPERSAQKAKSGLQAAGTVFSKAVVQERLYQFLREFSTSTSSV